MNKNNIAISVNDLSKVYKLYGKNSDRLKEALSPIRRKYHKDFYALKDVSFKINKGETVGIIGKNGSGKSTLLKILSGVLTPSNGTANVSGRISSLLELGAGFNPELTGLENIYFNGTIMGYSRKEMQAKVADIIEFAGIGDFIDQPVKTYSSGMFVRLAFATVINVDPDVLIVDEALSVGDIAFQLKCFDKFNKFKEAGKTIILVTHAIDTVIRYCNRCIVMDSGSIINDGTSKESVDVFKMIMANQYFNNSAQERESSDVLRYGDKAAEIVEYGLFDKSGRKVDQIFHDDEFVIKMKVKFNQSMDAPVLAYTIKDVMGVEITGTNTAYEHINIGPVLKGELLDVEFRQNLNLRSGNYSVSFGCVSLRDGELVVHDRAYDAVPFKAMSVRTFVGIYDPKTSIKVQRA